MSSVQGTGGAGHNQHKDPLTCLLNKQGEHLVSLLRLVSSVLEHRRCGHEQHNSYNFLRTRNKLLSKTYTRRIKPRSL